MKTLLSLLLVTAFSIAQQKNTYPRTYSDGSTRLTLNTDNTFTINQPDPVFPYSGTRFESKGIWKDEGKNIILNPHLEKRTPVISYTENYLPDSDSVSVKINYFVTSYKNENLTDTIPIPLQRFTIYLNKKNNYLNLVDEKVEDPKCLFGHKIRNAYTIDSIAIANFEKPEQVRKIGVKTYEFDTYIELIPKNTKSNYFEITIVQPVDSDRTPRAKKVRVNSREAYYYEHAGRFIKLSPLYLEK
ncbi:hypothetical protein [Flavobacterium alkalisoli]|uniref:hypothetical protein n=1 Tax=Flavobacterium alkalisoli TaxID=2602769 RepID=UPI003A8EC5E3